MGTFVRRLLLGAGALVMLAPYLFMVSASLKSRSEIFSAGLDLLPTHWAMVENYTKALTRIPMGTLLLNGADEINPVMAVLLYRGVAVFTTLKMGMTGLGTLLMVFLSRYRFMRLVPVQAVLYAVLLAYVALICYEISMLRGPIDLPIL